MVAELLDGLEVKATESLAKFMKDALKSTEAPPEIFQQIWFSAYQEGYQEATLNSLDGTNLVITGISK